MPFLQILVLANALSFLGTAVHWAILRMLRVPVTGIGFFGGPQVAKRSIGGLEVSLGCIPLGFSVTTESEAHWRLSWGRRFLLLLSPPGFLMVFAGFTLGARGALHHLATGFWQLPAGVGWPIAKASPWIGQWHAVFLTDPFAAAGILAAKGAAMALLPFGGSVVASLAWAFGERRGLAWPERFATFSVLAGLLIPLFWGIAALHYTFTRGGS